MKNITRREVLKTLGTTLLMPLIDGCGPLIKRIAEERVVDRCYNIKHVPFKEFNPISSHNKLKIEDKILETYLLNDSSLDNLNPFRLESKNEIKIKDSGRFESEIVSVAKELGVSEEKLKKLSIHDTVFLSGKIVASKLEYNQDMISKDEEKIISNPQMFETYAMLRLFGAIEDLANEESKRIGNLSIDEIFHEGNGICRNYSRVNKGVFEVLKNMNKNIENTYIKPFSPQDLSHIFSFPHSWNMVSTILKDEILITYVDPTWLDTRRMSVNNKGEKVNKDEKEIYNALDESHFYHNNILAEKYLAMLYERLGNNQRIYSDDPEIKSSSNIIHNYNSKAFYQRMLVCEKALKLKKNRDDFFADSFVQGVGDIGEENVPEIFLSLGLMPYKDAKKFERLSEIYKKALEAKPTAIYARYRDLDGKTWTIEQVFKKVKALY